MRRHLVPTLFGLSVVAMLVQSLAIASRRSMVLDEAVTLLHSNKALHGEWLELFADIHMPFYNVLIALWMKLFGFEIFSAKTFSVVGGAFAVVMTSLFARRFATRTTALGAVILISFSPLLMQYSQLARSYSFFIAMSALSSYFYLELSSRSFPWKSKWAVFYVLATVALMMTHMVGAGILVVQTLHVTLKSWRERSKSAFVSWWKIVPFVILLYVPVAATILSRYDLRYVIPKIYSWVPLPSLLDLVQSIGYAKVDDLSIAISFSFLIGFAIIRRVKNDEFLSYLLLWLLVPSILLFAYSYLHHPIFIRRGMAPAIVPLVILAGLGVERMSRHVAKLGWVAIAFIAWWGMGKNQDAIERDEESWAGVAAEIQKDRTQYQRRIAMFVRPGYAFQPLLYYIDRECFFSVDPEACMPRLGLVPIGSDSINGGVPFTPVSWFIGYGSEEKRNRELIEAFKSSHPNPETITSFPDFGGLDAIRFTSPSKPE